MGCTALVDRSVIQTCQPSTAQVDVAVNGYTAGLSPLLLNLSLCVGPQQDRVVGAAIDNLDETGDEVASIRELYQSIGTVNALPNQGSPPQDIPVLVNPAE